MGKKTRAGLAWKNGYSVYKTTDKYGKNRERDLRAHLEEFPNDETAKAALKNIRYRRNPAAPPQRAVGLAVRLCLA